MNPKECFVFCHGFGFDATFWQHLSPYFCRTQAVYLDLGYFGEVQLFPAVFAQQHDDCEYIGIGHSLGLKKLMSLNMPFKRFIGLQGFVNFSGFDERIHRRRKRELMTLTRHFQASPEPTLRQFYQRTGVEWNLSEKDSLNRHRLSDDLALLNTMMPVPKNVPMLILGSKDDEIVPPELIEDNFAHHPHVIIDILNHARHGLGYLQPEVVFQKIRLFLHE